MSLPDVRMRGVRLNGPNKLEAFRQEVMDLRKKGVIKLPGEGPVMVNGQAVKGVSTSVVEVTPAMAQEWLNRNKDNRALRKSSVTAFARDMKRGDWVLTHQGIAFSESGRLIDGQHRLSAVVEAGVAVKMMVTTGLPETWDSTGIKTMDAVDRGAARSVADQMSIQHGIANAPLVSAAALVIAQACIYPTRLSRVTVAQTLRIVAIYGEAIAWAIRGMSTVKYLRNAPVLGAVAFVWVDAKRRSKVEDFYAAFVSGANLRPGSPVLELRNFLFAGAQCRGSHADRSKVTERVLLAFLQYENPKRDVGAWKHGAAFKELADGQVENVATVKGIFE